MMFVSRLSVGPLIHPYVSLLPENNQTLLFGYLDGVFISAVPMTILDIQ